MMMDSMLSNISQRLHEVNVLLATYGQGGLSFERILPLSLFYQDFNTYPIAQKEFSFRIFVNIRQFLCLFLYFFTSVKQQHNHNYQYYEKYPSLYPFPGQLVSVSSVKMIWSI